MKAVTLSLKILTMMVKLMQTDRTVVGNGLPKFLFGFGNEFTYKNWDFNIFFRGVFGHDLINSFRAFYEVPNVIGSYNLPKTATDMRNADNRYSSEQLFGCFIKSAC